jgi:hypothetical protein
VLDESPEETHRPYEIAPVLPLKSTARAASPSPSSVPRHRYEVAREAEASKASAVGAAARPKVVIVAAAIKVLLKVFIVCFNLKVKFLFLIKHAPSRQVNQCDK